MNLDRPRAPERMMCPFAESPKTARSCHLLSQWWRRILSQSNHSHIDMNLSPKNSWSRHLGQSDDFIVFSLSLDWSVGLGAVLEMPSFVYRKSSRKTHNNRITSLGRLFPATTIFCAERECRHIDCSFRKAPERWYRSGCLVNKRVKEPVQAIHQVEEMPDAHRQDGEEYMASQAAFLAQPFFLCKVVFLCLF